MWRPTAPWSSWSHCLIDLTLIVVLCRLKLNNGTRKNYNMSIYSLPIELRAHVCSYLPDIYATTARCVWAGFAEVTRQPDGTYWHPATLAARVGDVRLLRAAHMGHKSELHYCIFTAAAQGGSIPCLDYLLDAAPDEHEKYWRDMVAVAPVDFINHLAERTGAYEMARWLSWAIAGNNIEYVKHVLGEQSGGNIMVKRGCIAACTSIDCLRLLSGRMDMHDRRIVKRAIAWNNVVVISYLHEIGVSYHYDNVAKHLVGIEVATLECLHRCGLFMTRRLFEGTIDVQNVLVLAWLIDNKCPTPDDPCMFAIKKQCPSISALFA